MKRYVLVLAVFGLATIAQAASGNWNADAAGNWSDTTKWSPATVPGTTAGDVVSLTYNLLTAARIVTIDTTARTVGTLNIGDPSTAFFGYTLAASGGASLTFDNSGSGASLVRAPTTAADLVSTPLILADNLTVNNSGSGGLTISGVVSDSGSGKGITKINTGTLTLTGANTYYGTTTINSGNLTLDFSATGAPASGIINNGATSPATANSALVLGSGTLTLKGKGTTVNTQYFKDTTLSTNRGSVVTLTQNSATSLTAALGAITRNAGSTLNFSSTPSTSGIIATTSTGNETSGILGPWASVSSGASLQYAAVNGSSQIISYSGANAGTAGTLANVTDATSNYTFAATATLVGAITANTLRYTGAAASLTNGGNNITLNGLMNASGSGTLTISGTGKLYIGANKELVVIGNNRQIKISCNVLESLAGTSSLVFYSGTSGANDLLYISSINNTYSGGTTVNGGGLLCQQESGKGTNMLGSGTVTINNASFKINNGAQTYANTFVLNSATIPASDNDLTITGPVTLVENNTFGPNKYGANKWTRLANTVSGSGGITVSGPDATVRLRLDAADTYTGDTIITLGILQLGAAGSINNTPLINIGAGGTFDVSLKTSPYTLSSSTTLSAAGTATPATLKGASGGTVNLGSQPIILTYNGSNPALTVSQGTLSLNANPFTVNGATLVSTPYTIVTQSSGSISSSGTYPGVKGTALPANKIGYITVSGANVLLNIADPALTVSGFPSSQTAGVAGSVTVTAKDPNGNTATAYIGTVHFTSTDPLAVLPADYTFLPSDNGTHTFSVTLKTAGAQAVTATDTAVGAATGTQSGITVTPASATTLTVSGFPASKTVGIADTVTVTAKDAYGNTATGYSGTVHFTSSDPLAVLPSNYTFLPSDNGTKAFSVTLNTVSGPTVSITATDTDTGTITGMQSGITVLADTIAATLEVTGFPNPQTAGTPGSVTVTAKLASGGTVTSYAGTIHFTSTDGAAVLPINYTFLPGDNGTHTFTDGVTLKTVAGGTKAITATDTGTAITGTQSGIAVTPADAATLTVAGFPNPQFAGTVGSVTITAKDAFGNTATGYTGQIHFTSTDGAAVLPGDYTFVPGDNGIRTFSSGVTLNTDGTQSITATDTAMGTIIGAQTGITINQVPVNFSWIAAGAGSWSDAANWTNNSGLTLAPATGGATNYVFSFNQANTYTATHNLGNGFKLNRLNFGGATATLAGNSLAFENNGATLPQVNQNSAVGVAINNDLVLGTNTIVGGSGGAEVTLSGVISGAGGLIKTNSSKLNISFSSGPNSYSGGTFINGGTLHCFPIGTQMLGTGTITINNAILSWTGGLITFNNAFVVNGNSTAAAGDNGASYTGPVALNGTLTTRGYEPHSQTFNGPVSGSGGFINDTAVLTFNGTNTYTGSTEIRKTLKLGASGSINSTTNIMIAAGATFDVSAKASPYTFSTTNTLSAKGTGTAVGTTAATIKGPVSGTVSLGSQPLTLTWGGAASGTDSTHPALTVSQGALTLDNNPIHINNKSGAILDEGIYRLIQVGDGTSGTLNQNVSPSYTVTVTGDGGGVISNSRVTASIISGNMVVTVAKIKGMIILFH
jgi:autotransporter-associated beta strand protein